MFKRSLPSLKTNNKFGFLFSGGKLAVSFGDFLCFWVSGQYGCFQKQWYPQIINFNRVFHYKPSILAGFPPIFGNIHIAEYSWAGIPGSGPRGFLELTDIWRSFWMSWRGVRAENSGFGCFLAPAMWWLEDGRWTFSFFFLVEVLYIFWGVWCVFGLGHVQNVGG